MKTIQEDFTHFNEIPTFENWIKVEQLSKGWSSDKKYYIKTLDGKEYLLRISDLSTYTKKEEQFNYLLLLKETHISFSKPLAFGMTSEKKVYTLLTWVEGTDANEIIPLLNKNKQYEWGYIAGEFLKEVHGHKICMQTEESFENYKSKIKNKIEVFKQCSIDLPKKDLIINYLLSKMNIVKKHFRCLTHGDFHIGNMVFHDKLGIVDFDKLGINTAYDDFKPFCWNVYTSPYFASGIINGYFSNEVPNDFFEGLSVYAAESLISHLPWAIKFGSDELNTALKVYHDVLEWFHDFRSVVPNWYQQKKEVN